MRLFIAIEVTGEAREELVATRQMLVDAISRQGVRFVAPDKLHLTVAFLGDVDNKDVEMLKAAISELSFPASNLRLGAIGAFPDMQRPKVIWLGLTGDVDNLADVARSVVELAKPFAPELDEKPFSPHITLARISPGSKVVGRIVQSLPNRAAEVEFAAQELVLIHSKPDGSYERL